MSLIEFIGFIITMVVLTILFFKRFFEQRRRELHPEELEEDEQKSTLNDFLSSLEGDMEDQKIFKRPKLPPAMPPPPPPPPKPRQEPRPAPKKPQRTVGDQFQFKGRLEQYRPETAIEKRTLKSSVEDTFYQSFDERLLSKDFRTSSTSAYDVVQLDKTSRIQNLIGRLPSLREMVIIKEIIGPPKGLQFPDEPC